ncbi:HAD-IB family hydrolase [Jonesiaceae bacterium BS-20]|uniref:HAD-IB family hydrolase n=1 Tax=Jonesiaceae bacterium BS-20 TaxID=3120821 RepID=A0AAU7DWC6_9MICO
MNLSHQPGAADNHRIAAFFDLDKTIIATSSAAAFSRPFYAGGLISRAGALRSAYAHFMFMVGGANADQTERMRAQLSSMVTGWPVEQVTAIVSDTLHQFIDPYVYAEALELIEMHRAKGHDIIIVSASGAELVTPIATMLGADDSIATKMEIKDGKYTGQIDFYAYGPNKALAIIDMAHERGYELAQCYAYSDSITDAPMLGVVGHAYTVNADRALRRMATSEGWDNLLFRRPVSLHKTMSPSKALAITGAGLLFLGVGIALAQIMRRKPKKK